MAQSWITEQTIVCVKRVLGRYLVVDLEAVSLDESQVQNIELLDLLEAQLERERKEERY